MNIQEARALINYNYWARDRVLAAADVLSEEGFTSSVTSSFGSVRDTLVHVLSAEAIWLSRWKGEPRSGMLSSADFQTAASVRKAWKEDELNMRAFFENVDDAGLTRVIEYKAFNGQSSLLASTLRASGITSILTLNRADFAIFGTFSFPK